MPQGTGGSNPSLSAKKFNIAPTIHPWRSTQVAVRGSPAKGVGWGDWREGSNPSFSAIFVHHGRRKDHLITGGLFMSKKETFCPTCIVTVKRLQSGLFWARFTKRFWPSVCIIIYAFLEKKILENMRSII